MRSVHSRLLRVAPLGVALAMGGASAHAQNVISRQVVEEPVETIVTQTPGGTVITRRPLAAPVAPALGAVAVERGVGPLPLRPYEEAYPPAPPATYVDETVGTAPAVRTVTTRRLSATHTTARVVRASRPIAETAGTVRRTTRSVQRTTAVRRVAGAPLVLDPAQRRIVYQTIVQEQVAPAAPVYPARPVVIPSTAGTGYPVPLDEADDDVYVEQDAVPSAFPTRYAVGAQLPAGVVLMPLPATTALRVPAIRPYSYVTFGDRVLLVDPATHTVVADITP
jgi:hypothetical protein